jgi:hypothetical protein
MPQHAVESKRQSMTATGIVHPVMEWGQNAEGRRIKTETQERNPETGMPMWDVEVLYAGSNFGQESTITANVTVGALEKPTPSPLTPISFDGLSVSLWVNKAGGMAERWEAEAITDLSKRPEKSNGTASANAPASSGKSSSSSAAAA